MSWEDIGVAVGLAVCGGAGIVLVVCGLLLFGVK